MGTLNVLNKVCTGNTTEWFRYRFTFARKRRLGGEIEEIAEECSGKDLVIVNHRSIFENCAVPVCPRSRVNFSN